LYQERVLKNEKLVVINVAKNDEGTRAVKNTRCMITSVIKANLPAPLLERRLNSGGSQHASDCNRKNEMIQERADINTGPLFILHVALFTEILWQCNCHID
jgi:hypothetical protein